MKLPIKLVLSITFLAALALSFSLFGTSSADANIVPPCPTTICCNALDGFTYLGTCANFDHTSPELGWRYQRGSEICTVAAETGL